MVNEDLPNWIHFETVFSITSVVISNISVSLLILKIVDVPLQIPVQLFFEQYKLVTTWLGIKFTNHTFS